ncbi:N-acetyltransferase [Shimia sp.]|uniref:GNAT family N-acetyltransferase n=1 Tax=Shimia sp. TaxID=1954381 RepID=UPI00329715E6
MLKLAQETDQDWWEVEALFDLCFAPGREALSSYRLRDGVNAVADLSLVARDEQDILAGAIRFWPVYVGSHACLLLGPVAVHPTHQGEGVGGLLIAESLDRAQKLNWARVMLVGDAPYYSRFGFEPLQGVTMPPPTNPARVLGYNLVDDAWAQVKGDVRSFADSGAGA